MFYTKLLNKIKKGINSIIQYLTNSSPNSSNQILYKLVSFFKTYHPGSTAMDFNKLNKIYTLLKLILQILAILFILVIFI